jgi:predicted HicB family RNase H-like nuclease
MKIRRLTIDVPEEVHKKLKMAAAAQGKSMKHLVLDWIEKGLSSPKK